MSDLTPEALERLEKAVADMSAWQRFQCSVRPSDLDALLASYRALQSENRRLKAEKCGAILERGESAGAVCVKPKDHADYHGTSLEDARHSKDGIFWWDLKPEARTQEGGEERK